MENLQIFKRTNTRIRIIKNKYLTFDVIRYIIMNIKQKGEYYEEI